MLQDQTSYSQVWNTEAHTFARLSFCNQGRLHGVWHIWSYAECRIILPSHMSVARSEHGNERRSGGFGNKPFRTSGKPWTSTDDFIARCSMSSYSSRNINGKKDKICVGTSLQLICHFESEDCDKLKRQRLRPDSLCLCAAWALPPSLQGNLVCLHGYLCGTLIPNEV